MSIFSRILRAPVTFVENKVEKAKEEVRKEAAKATASITMIVIMAVLALILVIFVSAALALYLNIVLESYYLGFLITGGFYLLLLIIVWRLRNNRDFMERLRSRYFREFGGDEEESEPEIPEEEEWNEEEYGLPRSN